MSRYCLIPLFCFTYIYSANVYFRWTHVSLKHILSTWLGIKLLTFWRSTLTQWWSRKENRGSIIHFSVGGTWKKYEWLEKLWKLKQLVEKSDSHRVFLKCWARTDFWFMLQNLETEKIYLRMFNLREAYTLKN